MRAFVEAFGPGRRVLVVLAAAFAGLLASAAPGATLVCGPINANTTWDLAGSPYKLTCDVHVLSGAILTIDPGVTVEFNPGTTLVVQDGRLVAEGGFAGVITFKSFDSTNKGNGVRVSVPTGATASIKQADLMDLNFAVQLMCCGVPNAGPPVVIENCTFSNNIYGVQGYSGGTQSQWVTIDDSIFVGNIYAIDSADKFVSDCSFYSNTNAIFNVERMTIQDCIFQANDTAISTPGNGYQVEVLRCSITNNNNGIVRAPVVRRCTITGNNVGVLMSIQVPVECNDIHSNNVANLQIQGSVSLNVGNNWWGTTSTSAIDAGIIDGFDQTGLGFAQYSPVLTGPWNTTSTCMCTTPSVTTQPVSQTVYNGQTVTFTVAASFVGAPTYQWRRNGVNLPLWSPRFGFSNAASLTINPVAKPGSEPNWTDAGTYDCVITNVCGSTTSNGAALTVNICGADFDQNSTVDVSDIFAFLAAWFAGCP
ncbi:MAG: immunoglobulin domain-containing protein [Phycisphaeraceae bacterium]|nr:immunoglobulin domain-containing protein [Phycisphaeraceae bacterium]